MGRGGHLPRIRLLQHFAIEQDRELQARLAAKDDAIFHMRLWCNKYFKAVQAVTSKYEQFTKELEALANANVLLRKNNENLSAKLFRLKKGLGSHTETVPWLTRKKYLSPKQKQKRLKFLLKRERGTRSK